MKVNPATTIPMPERKPAPPMVNGALGGGDFAAVLDKNAAPIPGRKPDPAVARAAGAPIPGHKPDPAVAMAAGAPVPARKPDLADVLAANAPIPGRKPDPAAAQLAQSPLPGRKPAASTIGAETANTESAPDMSRGEAARRIAEASRQVAGLSGHSYKAILAQAAQESRMNVNAKSRTSSAAGPFQFLEKTWLDMFRRHGAAYGMGELASKIEVRDGKPVVTDRAAREKILSLRHDIDISAGMAARLMSEGRDRLEQRLKRPVSESESRLAYVFGVGGALTLLRAAERAPQTPAAELLPGAAKANGPLFYDRKTGTPLSVTETLGRLNRKMNADHRDMFAAIDAAGMAQRLDGGPSPFNAFQTAATGPAPAGALAASLLDDGADESASGGLLANDGGAAGAGVADRKPV